MGHKSDSSTSSGGHLHHHAHHHGHSHAHRSVSRGKAHREPSLHSMTSASDLSSASSEASSVHKRSTPKIAAVIIAAIIVIAALVGITVYLIDSDRFERQAEQELRIMEQEIEQIKTGGVLQKATEAPNVGLDYQTYHDESASVMQKFRHTTFREGKDPEGPEALYDGDDEDYYGDEDVEPEADGSHHHNHHRGNHRARQELVVEGQGDPLLMQHHNHRHRQRPQGMFGNIDFEEMSQGEKDSAGMETASADPTVSTEKMIEGLPDANGNTFNPSLTQWPGASRRQDSSFYDTQPQLYQFGPRHRQRRPPPHLRPRQKFMRPGVQVQGQKMNVANLMPPTEMTVEQEEALLNSEANLGDLKQHPLPPGGSRGGIHVPVASGTTPGAPDATEASLAAPQGMNQLSTLDRRPGRPHFHHMGPAGAQAGRYGPAMRRRFQQQMFQRRMGLLQKQQQKLKQQKPRNPVAVAKQLLSQFDSAVAIAKSEAHVIQNIVRNITLHGKDVNLWEMLNAVNSTLQDNPNSALGRLMKRFYDQYLLTADDPMLENSVKGPVNSIYEKSLSSLLFLAFGIFLLNSVNEIIAHKGLDQQGRGFSDAAEPSTLALRSLLSDHSELLELFPQPEAVSKGRSLDTDVTPTEGGGNGLLERPTPTVDNFLKLVMNLMNAYHTDRDDELECIWSLYCHQLNRQASLGGMVSSVARINSVGMRVVLKEMPAGEAPGAMARNLWKWRPLQCEEMFPRCGKKFEEEEEEVEPEAEGAAESEDPATTAEAEPEQESS